MTWLTAELPGTGGVYKQQPEDFQVDEIPLYPCSGSGEHLYLWIEKTGISTRELITQLCRGLQLKERDIGHAGLKDARARTRQMISVPARCLEQLATLSLRQAEILQHERHGNKLRLGHLAGNRFCIRLKETLPDAAGRAEAIFAVLSQSGVPNRFGEQRYGVLGNSATLGRLLLLGNHAQFCHEVIGDPEKIRNSDWQAAASAYRQGNLELCLQQLPRRMHDERRLVSELLAGKPPEKVVLGLPRNLLKLYLSALQAQLFDQLLNLRLPCLQQLRDGDIAYKHENGACFQVEDAELEQPRADRFEISPTAPLFGYKVLRASGQTGEEEQALLDRSGLTPARWKLGRGLAMPGERRPLRVPLHNPQVTAQDGHSLTVSFSLPRGSYATSVLHELIK